MGKYLAETSAPSVSVETWAIYGSGVRMNVQTFVWTIIVTMILHLRYEESSYLQITIWDHIHIISRKLWLYN